MSDETQVRAAMQEYIDGSDTGDVARVKAAFHQDALMTGYMNGELQLGSPEPFFQVLENPPSGAPPTKGNYSAEIIKVELVGDIASVTLKEYGFLGMNFLEYFHLLRQDRNWKIISKTFHVNG